MRTIVKKLLTLAFAFAVFIAIYQAMNFARREVVVFIGTMLMLTMMYAELLVIRDEIWILTGSLESTRRWRDTFFPRITSNQQRLRKLIVMLFALVIFSLFYYKNRNSDLTLLTSMGIILLMTIQYFEILVIRDDVANIANTLKTLQIKQEVQTELTGAQGADAPAGTPTDAAPVPSDVGQSATGAASSAVAPMPAEPAAAPAGTSHGPAEGESGKKAQ